MGEKNLAPSAETNEDSGLNYYPESSEMLQDFYKCFNLFRELNGQKMCFTSSSASNCE